MSTDTVSPLRQRMMDDMNARKLGAHSQRSHISSCKRFAAFLKRSPDTATPDDVRRFQLHLAETDMRGPRKIATSAHLCESEFWQHDSRAAPWVNSDFLMRTGGLQRLPRREIRWK